MEQGEKRHHHQTTGVLHPHHIFVKSKEEASPHIKQWLADTFEERTGYVIEKKEVFGAYLEHCDQSRYESTNPAALGKILRRVFPRVQGVRCFKSGEVILCYKNIAPKRCSVSFLLNPSPVSTTQREETIPLQNSTFGLSPERKRRGPMVSQPNPSFFSTATQSLGHRPQQQQQQRQQSEEEEEAEAGSILREFQEFTPHKRRKQNGGGNMLEHAPQYVGTTCTESQAEAEQEDNSHNDNEKPERPQPVPTTSEGKITIASLLT